MAPDINSIIESTIRLQQSTNRLQMFTLAMIFVCNIFIVLSVLSIRKATKINKEWSQSNAEWSEHLRAASAIEARSDATGTGAAEGESATRQGDVQ